VRIDGDHARAWLLTNDRPSFEEYEESLIRIGSHWFSIGGPGPLGLETHPEIL
jgi:hypothetical protein